MGDVSTAEFWAVQAGAYKAAADEAMHQLEEIHQCNVRLKQDLADETTWKQTFREDRDEWQNTASKLRVLLEESRISDAQGVQAIQRLKEELREARAAAQTNADLAKQIANQRDRLMTEPETK